MRTKEIIHALLLCMNISTCFGFDLAIYRHGAIASERFRVVDLDENPVEGASVYGGFTTGEGRGDYQLINGMTDKNGQFIATGKCTEHLHYSFSKEGYYSSTGDIKYHQSINKVVDGKWQPYGEIRTVVLKRIKNPIKLSGSNVQKYHKLPPFGTWLGFDLERCDWVYPHGTGKIADMLLKVTNEDRDDGYVRTLDVSFTNNVYAGAYVMNCDLFSEMKTVYDADSNAVVTTAFQYKVDRSKDKGDVRDELKANQYLVFRTRTKVDAEGRLVAAHYGKIHGNWRFCEKGGMAMGPVAFNPTQNDTNLEDAETARLSR